MYVYGFKNTNYGAEGLEPSARPKHREPRYIWYLILKIFLVELGGLEPPTFSLQMRRSSQVNYSPKIKIFREWWACQESNLGPQSYQDCALTN